jgi:feruloyl esterase
MAAAQQWRRIGAFTMNSLMATARVLIALASLLWLTATPASAAGSGLANPVPVAPVMDCAALAQVDIGAAIGAKVTIQSASVHEGKAPYCEVRGVIAPAVGFEVRLPVSGWTQRYLQTGCAGLCGMTLIRPERASDCAPVADGAIVLASTDMGHAGGGMAGEFGEDSQARIDFAWRGVHLTALASKALIARYYGQPARYSYFSGCSDGGREALMEAQRFPGDFDGIAAGAPAMNFQVQNTFYHGWMALSNQRPDGSPILLSAKLPALHRAALAACDALDGLADGQITDPRACRFDPADAQCKPGETSSNDCLTAEEVSVARKFYEGPRDAVGHRFTIGGPQVGSELSWTGVFVPTSPNNVIMSPTAAEGTIRHVAFPQNPPAGFALRDFHFDVATFARLSALHPLYDATDTDLRPLEKRGGKLILWHGWSDPHISPINTIAYYEGVEELLGPRRTRAFARLFLFPGVYHCSGGDGPSDFDILTPLMAWVEGGRAPEEIVASRTRPQRTRPVFVYPQVARYVGHGSVDEVASFSAAPPLVNSPGVYAWEGARFMTPDIPR